MGRPSKTKSLHELVCEACAAVGPVPKRGNNEKYPYQKAAHVAAEFRKEIFRRGVLIRQNEKPPEFVTIETNGGVPITECRIAIEFTLTDGKESIGPDLHHGVGQDQEGKAIYKAITGAQKYFLRGLGLIPDEADDPEYDGAEHETGESLEDVAPMRVPNSQKPVTQLQIQAFNEACAAAHKSAEEVLSYLRTAHKVSSIEELKRGRPFTAAIVWASNGAGTLAPKPVAAPALQGSLLLPKPAPSFEMRVGGRTEVVQPKTGSYAL